MSGIHSQQADNLPAPPFDSSYTSRIRRRNRRYAVAAALATLAVATGVVVVLLANWLSTVLSK